MNQPVHPPRPAAGRLHDKWENPAKDIVLLPVPALTPEQAERHTLYSLLTMALVARYWNGNKRGPEGRYPWREAQRRADGPGYQGGDYLGHNIACIGVDGKGEVIDFDFNHNDLLNSSVEHAESRLVRRVFSLTQLYDDWATQDPKEQPKRTGYSTLLSEVTVYTSLESCSQCSGIMALGSVKEVVFLQRDPGQNSIGNILYNLRPVSGRYMPPLPLPADVFGFDYFGELTARYDHYATEVANRPFHVRPDKTEDKEPSITSFLCTDDAHDVFQRGAQRFAQLTAAAYPDFAPTDVEGALTNQAVLTHIKRFFGYAATKGLRGTPHKL